MNYLPIGQEMSLPRKKWISFGIFCQGEGRSLTSKSCKLEEIGKNQSRPREHRITIITCVEHIIINLYFNLLTKKDLS